MRSKGIKKILSVGCVAVFALGMVPNAFVGVAGSSFVSLAAEDNVYKVDGSVFHSFARSVREAIAQGKDTIEVSTNQANIENPDITSEIKHIKGIPSRFSYSDKIEFGHVAENVMTIKSGADVVIENINFNKRRDYDKGAYVVIEEGAKVKFVNSSFDNTVVNNGSVIFENSKFETGEIENNGQASYVGGTVEPKNIGTPSEKQAFVDLILSLSDSSGFERVVDRDEVDELGFSLEGTKKDEAKVVAEILPEGSNLSASVEGNKVKISGAPTEVKGSGKYTLKITATSTKEDGSDDIVSKEVPVSVKNKLSAKLDGKIQAYVVGSEGSGGVNVVSSATGSAGGSSSSDSSTVTPMVKEGDGEYIEYYDFSRDNPGTTITTKIEPEGSGLSATSILGKINVSGAPTKAGKYYLRATIKNGSREATTEPVEIRVYEPNVSFEDRLKELDSNLVYWEMEPYIIPKTGNAVIPNNIKKIYGSHESGLYGVIGNINTFATETITVPDGTDLTLVNMKVNSGTKIIVEKGGKLTLEDSVVYGNIEVNGGTLKFTKEVLDENGKVKTGRSATTGTITLNEGSVIEDSEIKSHADFLMDGSIKSPDPTEVVIVNGNVTFKGDNKIIGAVGNGKAKGQTALVVNNSTVTLDKGSRLTLEGGGTETYIIPPHGGDALKLNGGNIVGEGTLVAVGGYGHTAAGKGGDGVSGKGTIDVDRIELKGGDGGSFRYENNIFGIGAGGNASSPDVKVKANQGQYDGGSGNPNGSSEVVLFDQKVDDTDKKPGDDGKNSGGSESPVTPQQPKNEDGTSPASGRQSSSSTTSSLISPSIVKYKRISGDDRIETALRISKENFDKAKTVVVVSASSFADSLTASVLAKSLDAPILLTDSVSLSNGVSDEIKRLGATEVLIIGGEASVSERVKTSLNIFDKDVERIAGTDRYGTSALVAKRISSIKKTSKAVVATGENFADALAISPYAAKEGYPILLVRSSEIPKVIEGAISDIGINEFFIVGGEASVSKTIEEKLAKSERIAGNNRYETALKIAEKTGVNADKIYLASGEKFADALVVGSVVAKNNGVALLSRADSISKDITDYKKKSKIEYVVVVGGINSISEKVAKEIVEAR